MYRRAPGAGVISSRIFKCRRSTAMRKPISSCAHSRRICTESATWLDPGLSRAYSAICADCNDRITDCSSQSVIVSCRRPIARRITELSGHAAGLASPRSSLRATDRLWEAARCRRTSGRWRARLRLTAHAVRQPPGGWRSGGLAACAGRCVVMAGRAAAVGGLARRRRGRPRALAGRSTTRSLAGRPSSAARWSAAAQLVSESRPAARRQALDTAPSRRSCVAVITS